MGLIGFFNFPSALKVAKISRFIEIYPFHGKDEGIGSIPIEGANHHISIIPIVQKYYSEQIGIVPMVWYDIGKEQYPDEWKHN